MCCWRRTEEKGDQVAAAIFAWKTLPADKHVMTLPSDVLMQEPPNPSKGVVSARFSLLFTRDRLWVCLRWFNRNVVGFSLC